jgi:hypothetical protein
MLYRSTDRRCRAGAAVKNLSHSASFSRSEKYAPSNGGTKHKVFRDLVADRKNPYLMIDSTIVRAHQQAATGRKKGARTRLWGAPEEV